MTYDSIVSTLETVAVFGIAVLAAFIVLERLYRRASAYLSCRIKDAVNEALYEEEDCSAVWQDAEDYLRSYERSLVDWKAEGWL